MLVYEKIINGEKKIVASPSGIPSASDEEVTFRDKNGLAINPVSLKPPTELKDDGHGGILGKIKSIVNGEVTETVKEVQMWVGNTVVVPKGADAGTSTKCELLQLNIGTVTNPILMTFDGDDTFNFTATAGMDVSKLKPIAVLSTEATGKDANNKVWNGKNVIDFTTSETSPLTYTVTAEDGTTTKTYYASIIVPDTED